MIDPQVPRWVLLTEDYPADEEVALRGLSKSRAVFSVVVARDGAEALGILEHSITGSSLPSLVLLDLKMPKFSGLELLAELAKSDRMAHIPIVVMSSSDDENDRKSSIRLGARDFVRKPVDFEEYISTVAALADYWLAGLGASAEGNRQNVHMG